MATTGGGALATCIVVVLAAATLTLTTQPKPAAAYGRQASTPTAQFVQSICNTTVEDRVHVAYCYDALVEGRESYKGSHVKVVGAAVALMVKDLGAAAAELRKFKADTTTTGTAEQYDLAPWALKLLDYDVSVCRDLVRNYNKYTPAPQKVQSNSIV